MTSPFFLKLLLAFTLPFAVFNLEKESKHPFHVSTTEVVYNAKSKSLEVTCRIFTDDFEEILAKRYKAKADLSKSLEKQMNLSVKSYLESNLRFNVNGKLVKANYLGFENDHEATNVYLEISNISTLKQLSVSNSILYDLFDDQMNILHVEKNGDRKSTKVNFPERQMAVSF
jgi:hypothetical protein